MEALIAWFGCVGAAALVLSQIADLEEVELPPVAAAAIASYNGNMSTNILEPKSELEEPELEEPELEPELELELEETKPESPPGPTAEFDQTAVLTWVAGVLGLMAAQRAAVLWLWLRLL